MASWLRIAGLALSLAAVPTEAHLQEWEKFGIRESRFAFEVPPGFVLTKRADSGKAAMFEGEDGARLAVWGADLAKRDFKAQIDSQMRQDASEGWRLTYRRVTPTWASYSGIKEGKIRYFRAISVCGDKAAVFLLDYDRSEKIPFDPIVVRMVKTFKAEGC